MEGVDALVSLLRQESSAHPGYVGGPATPSQQQRQSTPPVSLSAEAVQSIRQASVKLFGELGLQDYAQFSGWVLPPQAAPAEAAPEAGAGLGEEEEQQAAKEERQQRRRAGKSYAELLELDAAARSQAAAAAGGAGGSGITAADRAGATDTTADPPPSSGSALLDAELAAATAAGAADGGDYGWYNGIRIDGSTRVTNEEAVEASTGAHRWAVHSGAHVWAGNDALGAGGGGCNRAWGGPRAVLPVRLCTLSSRRRAPAAALLAVSAGPSQLGRPPSRWWRPWTT